MKDYWKEKWIRWKHWEYWNSAIIYFPILPYLIFLMLKRRDAFFFIAANPGIENGGFTLESKWNIQDRMKHQYFPKTMLVSHTDELSEIKTRVQSFRFPLYLKPDIGGKGRGVIQIESPHELDRYHNQCPVNYLIQEKISYPLEIGLFFIKRPGQLHGYISGIVFKEFIEVEGNGEDTLEELLKANPRYFLQFNRLKKTYPEKMLRILKPGEKELLSEIGNHALGSAFTDCSDKITPALTKTINEIAAQLNDFYFGRLDIRFNSWEELEQGKNFAIVEINGAGSEPTHIYDASHSLLFAWSEIMRHWKAMSEISGIINERRKQKIALIDGIRLLMNHRKVMKQLDHFSGIIQSERA